MKVHETEIRVRYQETDNMGVVYYANYLTWFEVARTEYFRAAGLVYRKLEEKGIYLMVASASCQYRSPARYDDVVKLHAWVPELKNSSLKFAYKLFVGEKVIAQGESVHVFTDARGKPTRIPEEVRRLFHP
ncbi:MAG: thioesterase family protein [Candidatus Omnitrophota bacterium]